jgi:DNA-binding Lrp family transcriptional regulator
MSGLDELDRRIVNLLQEGIPVCEQPYLAAAQALGLTEAQLLERLQSLLDRGVLSRFGPMFNVERLGGAFTLAAMRVPAARFDEVCAQVNARPQVAHNYAREHEFNMWFVIAAERPEQVGEVIAAIEADTGLPVYNLPKRREFRVRARFRA